MMIGKILIAIVIGAVILLLGIAFAAKGEEQMWTTSSDEDHNPNKTT